MIFSAARPCHIIFNLLNAWSEYRLSLADMQSIRDQSTHWRVTCEFPKNGADFRDASLEDFDVVKNLTYSPGFFSYLPYELINIRGNQCIDCTALTNAFWTLTPAIRSYENKLFPCEFDGRPNYNGGMEYERNCGIYSVANPAFRCSATKNSITQYWLGKI